MDEPEKFIIKIADLQPSQLYISQRKLEKVQSWFSKESFEAIPVIKLSGQLVITDGHTRTLAALLAGWTEIPVYYDSDELDLEIYRTCVGWAKAAKINSPEQLKRRILSESEYQRKWIDYCAHVFGDK